MEYGDGSIDNEVVEGCCIVPMQVYRKLNVNLLWL